MMSRVTNLKNLLSDLKAATRFVHPIELALWEAVNLIIAKIIELHSKRLDDEAVKLMDKIGNRRVYSEVVRA